MTTTMRCLITTPITSRMIKDDNNDIDNKTGDTNQDTDDKDDDDDNDNALRFKDVADTSSGFWYYSYNPCVPFSEGTCSDTAVSDCVYVLNV